MKSISQGLLVVALMTGFAMTSAPVLAQDAGFYAGGAFGQSKIKDACDGLGAGISCDDTDSSWKIFGGYQFNKNFAAELGYVDLGKATASAPGVTANVKAKGFEFLGVGTLPLSDGFSAYGKLGFFRWDADASIAIPAFGALGTFSESGTDVTFGIGVKYDFTKNVAARLEWQRYKDLGNDATIGKSDVDVMSIGVVFKF